MAVEVRTFDVTIPAGTLPSAPAVTQMRFPVRVVDEVEVLVPPGPRGEVGFRIGSSGTQLIPFQPGNWLVTDNETLHIPLEDQHDSGSWEFTGYNTGLFAHTIEVRFLVSLPGQQKAGPAAAIAASDLGAVPGADETSQPPPLPQLPAPPPGALPALPQLVPPILPVIAIPGQTFSGESWSDRQVPELAASYGGQLHVFSVDTTGQLLHRRYGRGWSLERLAWATGLVPSGWLAGGRGGGQAHVFAPLQAGGVLHLAQPEGGGGPDSWGGETLGGA